MSTDTEPSSWHDVLTRQIRRIPIGPAVILCAVVIGLLAIVGILQRVAYPDWVFANLDSEAGAGKWVGSGLLWAAAAVWFLVAANGLSRRPWVWIWWPLLVWLAADEGNGIHERVERWLGIDWQVLYAPLIILGAAAWSRLLRAHRRARPVALLFMIGAGAWATSLVLEAIQNWGGNPIDRTLYDPMMVTEEILEMIGSTVFFTAGLIVLKGVPADRSASEEAPGDPHHRIDKRGS